MPFASSKPVGRSCSRHWRTKAILFYAENELRTDRQIVLEAARNDGAALAFASDELRADRDVVLWAAWEEGSMQTAEVFGIGGRLSALREQGADSDLLCDVA